MPGPDWRSPDHERDCCGSEGSRSMWGFLLGGVLLCIGIMCGVVAMLLASGVVRLIGRLMT